MKHWAAEFIGREYQPRGRGPDAFDCWGLCAYVWRMRFGVNDLPNVAIDPVRPRSVRERFAEAIEAGDGCHVAVPFEGCAVLMSRARLPDHVGIYVDADGGGVLHCLESVGVVFTKLSALKPAGLNVLGFYRPRGMSWPTSMS